MSRIVAFYSHDPLCATRTAALARVAAALAERGRRVLVVGWTEASPSLVTHFDTVRPARRFGGLVSLLTELAAGQPGVDDDYVSTVVDASADTPQPISLLSSGQAVNWERFYAAGGGAELEKLRERWHRDYELVLLDAGSGRDTAAAIALIQLADIAVAVVNPVREELVATRDRLRLVQRARRDLIYDRMQLAVVPIATGGAASDSAELLGEFTRVWTPASADQASVLERLAIADDTSEPLTRLARLLEEDLGRAEITLGLAEPVSAGRLPGWARWVAATRRNHEWWTVSVTEEAMLLRRDDEPARRFGGDPVPVAIPLVGDPHQAVGAAAAQMQELRAALAADARLSGLRAAVAGTHPMLRPAGRSLSEAHRDDEPFLHELARQVPKFSLLVRVAVHDSAHALRAFNGLRAHIPVLVAFAGNSPFAGGLDTGLASSRCQAIGMSPNAGIPPAFDTVPEYVEAVDFLLRTHTIPTPNAIAWDLRLNPRLASIELRVMDAQTRLRDSAALVALVQCLVRLEAVDGFAESEPSDVLDQNRFRAARDGHEARLFDSRANRHVQVTDRLATIVDACWPHARALGCERELALLAHLAADPGAARQRALASEPEGMHGLLRALAADFDPNPREGRVVFA